MKRILLIDFGSTYTKVTAVDPYNEIVLGTSKAFTTVHTDIWEGLENAVEILSAQISKPLDMEDCDILACSSAAGGLKMIASGLVPDLTAEAAKRAALSAGARVLRTYSYELTQQDAEEIYNLKPDIFLLTGGTDGGNKNVILHNAKVLSQINGDFPVIVAGNKSAALDAAGILYGSGREIAVCENVMPEFNILNIEPAQAVIRNIFLGRIVQAKGLSRIQKLVKGIVMPTPKAVLNAAALLSQGCGEEKGIGDLLVVDVGGATTDVHSIANGLPAAADAVLKGLPEPLMKRTVEGDLGVRYSAGALIDAVGMKEITLKTAMPPEKIREIVAEIGKNPGLLGESDKNLYALDSALASMAVKLAVERHAGRLEKAYTPFGVAWLQTGKDLSAVDKIIGTGGPVIYGENPRELLKAALWEEENPMVLKPKHAQFLLDRKYILAAMGLLGERYPEMAVRIMKRELSEFE